MAVNAAANNPADDFFVTSVVNRYEEKAANAENIGAINTHILRIFMVMLIKFKAQ